MHTFILCTLIHSGQLDWAISLQGGHVLRENIMFCNFVFPFFSHEKLYPCALGCVFGCVSEQTFTCTKCLWDLSVALNNTTLELSLFVSWKTELRAHTLARGYGGTGEAFSGPEMFKTNILQVQVQVWEGIVWSNDSQMFWQPGQQLQISSWCRCCNLTVICSQEGATLNRSHRLESLSLLRTLDHTLLSCLQPTYKDWLGISIEKSWMYLRMTSDVMLIIYCTEGPRRHHDCQLIGTDTCYCEYARRCIPKHQNKIQLYCDWQIRLSETKKQVQMKLA